MYPDAGEPTGMVRSYIIKDELGNLLTDRSPADERVARVILVIPTDPNRKYHSMNTSMFTTCKVAKHIPEKTHP